MDEAIFRCLYNELMLQSNNGEAEVECYWMVLTEASKCSGRPREEVRDVFLLFEKEGLVRKTDEEKLTYIVTPVGANRKKAKEIFNHFYRSGGFRKTL